VLERRQDASLFVEAGKDDRDHLRIDSFRANI
jgi:hypothetical protein